MFALDTVDFFSGQTALQSRQLLYQDFKLFCFCLDYPHRTLRFVEFSTNSTEDPTSKLVEVVLPVQTNFHSVPKPIGSVISVSLIYQFLQLELTFENIGRTSGETLGSLKKDHNNQKEQLRPLVGKLHQGLFVSLRRIYVLMSCYLLPRMSAESLRLNQSAEGLLQGSSRS